MKYFYLALILLAVVPQSNAQIVNIPDPLFKSKLLEDGFINSNYDTEIQVSEAAATLELFLHPGDGISDLTGLEAFVNLKVLYVDYNPITSINLSQNTALEELTIAGTPITSLNLTNNVLLDAITAVANQITTMDLSNNIALTYFYYGNNPTTSITFGNNTLLDFVEIFSIPVLTTLDFSNCVALRDLRVAVNGLTTINVCNNLNLERLLTYGNSLTELNVSNNTLLHELNTMYNNLVSLDVSNNPALTFLNAYHNNLSTFDVRNGANSTIEYFSGVENPDLTCIIVDDSNATYLSSWFKDATGAFVNDNEECEALSEGNIMAASMQVYPNPVKNNLFIVAPDLLTGVGIYTVAGQLVDDIKFKTGTFETLIDVQHLPSGVYTVKIESAEGETVKKVIKY